MFGSGHGNDSSSGTLNILCCGMVEIRGKGKKCGEVGCDLAMRRRYRRRRTKRTVRMRRRATPTFWRGSVRRIESHVFECQRRPTEYH